MFPANSRAAMNAYRSVGVESIADSAPASTGAHAVQWRGALRLRRRNCTSSGTRIAPKCGGDLQGNRNHRRGLKASLDLKVGGELSKNLSDLYDTCARLVYANSRTMQEHSRKCRNFLRNWRAWS